MSIVPFSLTENKTHLFYGAMRTCLDMFKDRNYQVPGYLFNLTEKQFSTNRATYAKISGILDSNSKLVFLILYDGSEKVQLFNEIYDFLKSLPSSFQIIIPETGKDSETKIQQIQNIRLFIIYDISVAASNLAHLNQYYIGDPNQPAPFIEAFDVSQMYINPTKHIYQPKWRLLSETEITEILQHYGYKSGRSTKNLFPAICIDDPINRYYGGKPPNKEGKGGDMYEIIRDGVSIFYRKVSSKRMNLSKK